MYEVSNITVKPVRKDKSGKDLRTTVEKVGHPVQFRDTKGRYKLLPVGGHSIVDEIDEGLAGLARGGFVGIKKIEDITVALREHTLRKEDARQSARVAKAAATPKNDPRRAKASQMGQQDHSQVEQENEGAVNPDGEPNFVAKPNANRRRKGNGSPAGSSSDEA